MSVNYIGLALLWISMNSLRTVVSSTIDALWDCGHLKWTYPDKWLTTGHGDINSTPLTVFGILLSQACTYTALKM